MFASRTWTSLRSSSFPPKPTAAASARTTRRSCSTAGSAALRRRTRAVGWSSAALRGRSCVGTAHHELGFGRLGDYSRERIGLSARELQSLATVSAHLERLPRLRAAFVDGVLSWAQIRLLAAVATPEDEAEWLSRAEGRTVCALAAVMRTPPDGDDDEARFRLRCPRRVRLLWQQ